MPAEGVELTAKAELLSAAELDRLMGFFVSAGISKIRFTGGEPLVRADIAAVLSSAGRLRAAGLQELCVSTNGLLLERRLPALLEAGLTAVNVSLDTLDPLKFELITRRRGHERVLAAIDSALAALSRKAVAAAPSSLRSVKVNCVVMRGINDDELLDFVRFTQDRDCEVRFIEYMRQSQQSSSSLLAAARARPHPPCCCSPPLLPAAPRHQRSAVTNVLRDSCRASVCGSLCLSRTLTHVCCRCLCLLACAGSALR